MINLLPPERTENMRYGRVNRRLIKWSMGLTAATIGLALIIGGGSLYLKQQVNLAQTSVDASQTELNAQNLPKIQADANEISGDVKVINQVLNSEVRFSDLFRALGKIMPQGSVLGSISLSKISGAIKLTASAADSSTATQVAINIGDPANGIFSKVDINDITCSSNTQGTTGTYNCTIELTALFNKTTQSKFLGVAKASP